MNRTILLKRTYINQLINLVTRRYFTLILQKWTQKIRIVSNFNVLATSFSVLTTLLMWNHYTKPNGWMRWWIGEKKTKIPIEIFLLPVGEEALEAAAVPAAAKPLSFAERLIQAKQPPAVITSKYMNLCWIIQHGRASFFLSETISNLWQSINDSWAPWNAIVSLY